MCLDDNHSSVVLACAKVIQCALSCDLNENFFEISEVQFYFRFLSSIFLSLIDFEFNIL